jgi:hypothetical protein
MVYTFQSTRSGDFAGDKRSSILRILEEHKGRQLQNRPRIGPGLHFFTT